MVVCDRGSRMSVLFGLRVGRMVGILTGVEVGLVEAV